MSRRPARFLLAIAGSLAATVAHADSGIVAVAPTSGDYAALGDAVRQGLADAGQGTVTVLDDRCDVATAVDVAKRVVGMRPSVVIGHPCSGAAIAAAPVYAEARIPFVSTGARHPDLTQKRAGPQVFRLAGRDDRQGLAAAEHLQRMAGTGLTFAMSTIAGDAAKALPTGLAVQFPFVASELDYDALVMKVVAAAGSQRVGAVLFAGFSSEAIVILRSLRAKGVAAPFIAVEANATPDFGRALRMPGDGDVFVLSSGPPNAAAVRQFAAIAIRAWDAAKIADAGDPGGTLQTVAFVDPALGKIGFDANGDVRLPSYRLSAWKDGVWELAGPGHMIPGP